MKGVSIPQDILPADRSQMDVSGQLRLRARAELQLFWLYLRQSVPVSDCIKSAIKEGVGLKGVTH